MITTESCSIGLIHCFISFQSHCTVSLSFETKTTYSRLILSMKALFRLSMNVYSALPVPEIPVYVVVNLILHGGMTNTRHSNLELQKFLLLHLTSYHITDLISSHKITSNYKLLHLIETSHHITSWMGYKNDKIGQHDNFALLNNCKFDINIIR